MNRFEKVLLDTPNYRIIEACLRGYEPRFELYERRKFLFFSWWSFVAWSMKLERIYEAMNKRMQFI